MHPFDINFNGRFKGKKQQNKNDALNWAGGGGKRGGHISAPYLIQNALLRSNCTFFIKAFLKM